MVIYLLCFYLLLMIRNIPKLFCKWLYSLSLLWVTFTMSRYHALLLWRICVILMQMGSAFILLAEVRALRHAADLQTLLISSSMVDHWASFGAASILQPVLREPNSTIVVFVLAGCWAVWNSASVRTSNKASCMCSDFVDETLYSMNNVTYELDNLKDSLSERTF